MEGCPISGDLGVDHLTFEGEGGKNWLVQEFFLTGKWCRHNFLGLCMHFFSHACCMFFLTAKALQEIFSQIFYSSPQRSNGWHPVEEPIKHLQKK